MKTALRNKWVRALRSGRYKQIDGKLEEKKGFNCCLGVLCRISKLKSYICDGDIYFDEDFELLTPKLGKQFGLSRRRVTQLANMNDGGDSFREIADWIKENL